mgnify:FL=1
MSYYDLQSSARYVQCPGALREIKRYTFGMGNKFLVITSCRHENEYVYGTIRKSFASSCEEMLMPEIAEENFRYNRQMAQAKRFDAMDLNPTVEFVDYGGCEITERRVDELVRRVKEEGFDCVVGVGGGKGMDYARAVAYHTDRRCVLVPTMASTNASASPLCVIYSEDGSRQVACHYLANYQDLVIADTSMLIRSPARGFAAGIGDQLCTYLEVEYTNELMGTKERFPSLSWSVIRESCDIFLSQGKAAYEAAKAGRLTREYENVLSQVLYSNAHMRAAACSGFAHLLAKALVLFPGVAKKHMHGAQVAYAILPMKVHRGENKAEILRYADWCRGLDIPITLEELGIGGVSREELLAACREIAPAPTAELPYTPEELTDSVLAANGIVCTGM